MANAKNVTMLANAIRKLEAERHSDIEVLLETIEEELDLMRRDIDELKQQRMDYENHQAGERDRGETTQEERQAIAETDEGREGADTTETLAKPATEEG